MLQGDTPEQLRANQVGLTQEALVLKHAAGPGVIPMHGVRGYVSRTGQLEVKELYLPFMAGGSLSETLW